MMSKHTNRKFVLPAIALSAVALVAAPQANALSQLRLTSGVETVTIADNGAGDLNPASGVIAFNDTLNGLSIDTATGLSFPTQGALDSPLLDLSSVNVTGGPADLLIEFTTTGFNGPTPKAEATLTASGRTNGLVSIETFLDLSNAAFGTGMSTAILADISPSLPGSTRVFSGVNSGTGLDTDDLYSATIVATIAHDQPTQETSFDAEYRIVPEPTSLAMLAAGGLLLMRRKRA